MPGPNASRYPKAYTRSSSDLKVLRNSSTRSSPGGEVAVKKKSKLSPAAPFPLSPLPLSPPSLLLAMVKSGASSMCDWTRTVFLYTSDVVLEWPFRTFKHFCCKFCSQPWVKSPYHRAGQPVLCNSKLIQMGWRCLGGVVGKGT